MPLQYATARRAIRIVDTFDPTVGVTGLSGAAITTVLERMSGDARVAATEVVTLVEASSGNGYYFLEFTPENAGLYFLTYTLASTDHTALPGTGFQLEVTTDTPPTGQYLITLAEYREQAGDTQTSDAIVNSLIRAVTARAQKIAMKRPLVYKAGVTEYPRTRGTDEIFLDNFPIDTITSLHCSTALPRVWDSTTLLVEGEDYIVDTRGSGRIWRMGARWPSSPHSVQVIYAGGMSPIPDDLQRAVLETMLAKREMTAEKLYHIQGSTVDEGGGSISGIRNQDIPPGAMQVFMSYRSA